MICVCQPLYLQFEGKDSQEKLQNIQCAQIGKLCRKIIAKKRNCQKKLSTVKNVENSKKMSYTPSYSHYPQKKWGISRGKKPQNQTYVL